MRQLMIVGACLMIAACGGSGPAATPPTRPSVPATFGAATSAPNVPPVGTFDLRPPAGAAADPCALLTDDEIDEATGRTVDTVREGPVMGIFANGCTWELGLGDADMVPVSIEIGAVNPGGRDYYDRYLKIVATESVPGIGDEATTSEAGGIDAVKGDTLLSIYVIAFGDEEDQITRDVAIAAFEKVP